VVDIKNTLERAVFTVRRFVLDLSAAGPDAIHSFTANGAFACFSSSHTAAGRITLSNNAGRISTCPMSTR